MPSSHTFVVDISRHIGEPQSLIGAVVRQMQTFTGSTSVWYSGASQVLPSGLVRLPRVDGEQPAATISHYIRQHAAAGSVFHVLSYDRFVLQAASGLNSESAIVIPTHIHAFAFPESGTSTGTSITEGSPAVSDSVPLTREEAIELARQVLRNGKHTSEASPILQSKLRFTMGPRARKNPFDPSSAFLIKTIVQDGLTKGWLKQKGASGSEVIWLTDGIPASTTESLQPAPESRKLQAEQPREITQKPPTRASLMEACLRSRGIGSPPAVRPLFFDAIQDIMSKKGPSPLSAAQLMRQSREQVAKQWSPGESGKKTPNWEAISVCILNMLLASGVLLGENDTALNEAIGGQSGSVVKLHSDFRDKSEAFLIFHIIKKMGDVTTSDKTNIGLALYQRGNGKDKVAVEDLIGRVDTLLAMLQKAGKIDVEDDHIKPV